MALELQATYSKKLGLPNFSSHCFVVSLRTELSDLSQVEAECARLYALLQQSVDSELEKVGFLPDATRYGMEAGGHGSRSRAPQPHPASGNRLNGHGHPQGHGNGSKPGDSAPAEPEDNSVEDTTTTAADTDADAAWNCTDKQRLLIVLLGQQARLAWEEVEAIAQRNYQQSVRTLDRKQASGLIETLLAVRDEHSRHAQASRGGSSRSR